MAPLQENGTIHVVECGGVSKKGKVSGGGCFQQYYWALYNLPIENWTWVNEDIG